jgi:3-methylcrotonyl-CoA carboxylase alpha subunit
MLKRLLIANRGEIVCRIARTARRLGVTSIAVYSDADRGARHARECDEAYHLGASAAAESYLNIAKLIALAQRVKADALHPGYGFLSENADLAQACADAGIIFVGPPASAIRAMGSKSASKAAMAAVGVPVAPGYHGADQDLERLTQEAARVGFPLIIKASAGGGGKGMQVVNSVTEVAAAVESAKRLARTSFGDDHLLMERYFAKARHVEVQVFADSHGNTVSLFDRDCSVQRRHQKIIEEAPAPQLRADVRAAMSAAAIKAAEAVGYRSAGTVEFLVDEAQNFYFMEMNTRLQVEHPVTELITGLDLVEWQLRVASGEPLPKTQAQIGSHGCAIEARLYAEDPAKGYLPSVGRISHLRWPQAAVGLRLDMGVEANDEVSSYYDPMLGKVIAFGETREAAVEALRRALSEIEIAGVTTNRALLTSVLGDAEFRRGGVGTNYLALRHDHLVFGEPLPDAHTLALTALWCATSRLDTNALWDDRRGWRSALPGVSRWLLQWGSGASESALVQIESSRGGTDYRARVQGSDLSLRLLKRDAQGLRLERESETLEAHIVELDGVLHVYRGGTYARLTLKLTEDSLQQADAAEQGSLLTPLPGTVVAVHVRPGQSVAKGAPLVTVEAMKMEHTLTAPYEGVVGKVAYGVSDRVAAGAVLVELTEA